MPNKKKKKKVLSKKFKRDPNTTVIEGDPKDIKRVPIKNALKKKTKKKAGKIVRRKAGPKESKRTTIIDARAETNELAKELIQRERLKREKRLREKIKRKKK